MKKKKATVLKDPWYGFDHKKVAKKYRGGLTFLNEFCVKGEYNPVAVYLAKNPDVSKGHKRYMLLQKDPLQPGMGIVRGMTEEEMKKERYQGALHCLKCNYIIFSANRHDYHPCKCKDGRVCIDGGKDYTKVTFDGKKSEFVSGTLDLVTDTFTPNPSATP